MDRIIDEVQVLKIFNIYLVRKYSFQSKRDSRSLIEGSFYILRIVNTIFYKIGKLLLIFNLRLRIYACPHMVYDLEATYPIGGARPLSNKIPAFIFSSFSDLNPKVDSMHTVQ